MFHVRFRASRSACMEAVVHAHGYGPRSGNILTPRQLPIRRKDAHCLRQLERDSTAEIQRIRADEPVMIAQILVVKWSSIVDSENIWRSDKIYSVVGALERLDELNRQPWSHEVADGTVDPSPIRSNIHGLLDECIRNASLKVEAGQQVISEPTDCRTNDQCAEIPTDGGLREALYS